MHALVDLDGTLVDRDAGFARWLELFCSQRGVEKPGRVWAAELDGRLQRNRQRFFVELVDGLGLEEDPELLWIEYRAAMPTLTAVFPGVAEALAALRDAGWRLAVLSNGEPDNQHGKLEAAGLLGYFSVCRFSGQSGLRKPDPGAFHDVLDALGARPGAAVWMVGDDPELDVAGAQGVGLSTMWISHGRSWPPGRAAATRTAATPAAGFWALALQDPAA